jgi:tetraacyldisaccharide 4'-kinase
MIGWMLTPCSLMYRGSILLRHFLYDKKILKKKYAPLPVVSIGNVMVGGAGKTQAALLLAEQLSKEFSTAILSRGYLSRAEHASTPLVVDTQKHRADQCGDEPWLLASRLQSTLVVVNKNRFKSALVAEKQGAQLLLLDDGMQHRRLHRDFEIIVIDGKTPFGSFLPTGHLREDLSRLKTADLILFVGEPDLALKNQVTTQSCAPQVVADIVGSGFFQLDGKPVENPTGKQVGVFCGIGNPTRFVATVEKQGLSVVSTHFVADHRTIGEKALLQFAHQSKQKGASFLVCTEKDKVKLSSKALPLPLLWLKAQLEVVSNQTEWTKLIDEIKRSVP